VSPATAAGDDVVARFADVAQGGRPPLLVLEPLAAFLDAHGIGSGPIEPTPIGEGKSNVIYLLRRGDLEVVLRRPPRPPIPPSAHDVLREARILRALSDTAARVPPVLAVCDDEAVIGAPFYVMAKVDGHVVTDTVPAELDTPQERRRMGEVMIDALVDLHAVDWRAVGLEGLGKPTGYLERQLRRFGGLWELNRTRELPLVEEVGAWLAENLPQSPPSTIVHGDFRIGNLIYAPSAPATVAAVLDWEMATIGDPLADLGYLCALWIERDDPPRGMYELNSATRAEGFPSREELIARYERASGRAMGDIAWYETLALWKSVVFMEGNYRRALMGASDDPFLHAFGDGVVELAERAAQTSGVR
jgi:aminoglycoside phosphotransferase (APT) family kinase protein